MKLQELRQLIREEISKMDGESKNTGITKAWIPSHEDYKELYLSNDNGLKQYVEENDGYEPEYIIDIPPGKIQIITWNDEGPFVNTFNSIKNYIKQTIQGYWGEDMFIDYSPIEKEINAAGDDWDKIFYNHVKNNPKYYFNKLNKLINESYPESDSGDGIALLVDGKLIAGADKKKAVIVI